MFSEYCGNPLNSFYGTENKCFHAFWTTLYTVLNFACGETRCVGEGGETWYKFFKSCYVSKSIVDQAAAVAFLDSPFISLSGYIITFALR